jgi:Arc/MetJ-type ribon-helix-helix transcriptional regulator
MKIITINIPDDYLEAIQGLVDLGLFQSRSDFVREAIRDFLDSEKKFESTLNENTIYELFKDIPKIELLKE